MKNSINTPTPTIKFKLELIAETLRNHKNTGPITNQFFYLGETFDLDYNACKKAYDIIKELSSEEKKRLTLKTNNFKGLIKEIETCIHDALDTPKLKKSSEPNFIINGIKQKIAPKQIAYVINSNISYLILEDVHIKYEFHGSNLMRTSYVAFAMAIGESLFKLYTLTLRKKTKNKTAEDYFNELCIKQKNSLKSPKLASLLWNQTVKGKKEKVDLEFRSKLLANIGGHFIEYLLKHNIFEETELIKRTRYLQLVDRYHDDIFYSAVFCKPLLHPALSSELTDKQDIDKFSFRFISKARSRANYSHVMKEPLVNCLKKNDVRYCINAPFLKMYQDYAKQISAIPFDTLSTDPSSENSKTLRDYISITFDINIIAICKAAKDDTKILKEFLNFIGDTTSLADADLAKNLRAKKKKAKKELDTFKKELKKDSPKTSVIDRFVNLSNDCTDKIQKLLQSDNCARVLLDSYYKIMAKKFFIINFLPEADLYSHFSYFMLEKHLSGVGRIETKSHMLSYQTNKFARPFINYFCKNTKVNKRTFTKIKKIFEQELPTVKENLKSLSYTEYEEKTLQYQDEHLNNFLKQPLTQEELLTIDFSNLEKTISCLRPKVKKAAEVIPCIALLYQLSHKDLYKNIEPVIFLDSTTSGTQHLASIFRDARAAEYSCLTGNKYLDINLLFLEKFKEFVTIIVPEEAIKRLSILNLTHEVISKAPAELYQSLYKALIGKPLHTILELEPFLELLWKEYSQLAAATHLDLSAIPFIDEISCLTPKIKSPGNANAAKLYNIVLTIIANHTVNNLFTREPWILENGFKRGIIKKRIMADAYGMSEVTGIHTISDALFDEAIEQGYLVNLNCIDVYSGMMSSYFSKFKEKHLPYMTSYLNIREYTKTIKGSLSLSTDLLTWSTSPKTKSDSVRLGLAKVIKAVDTEDLDKPKTKNKRRFINIQYYTETLDKQKIRQSICPNIVHTQEARLMMYWLISSQSLNQQLRKMCKMNYYYTHNYDCFGANYSHIVWLRYQLEHSYNLCYNKPLFPYLLEMFKHNPDARDLLKSMYKMADSPAFWNGKITNPFFVKY